MHVRRREEVVEVTDNRFLKLSDMKITTPEYTLILPLSPRV